MLAVGALHSHFHSLPTLSYIETLLVVVVTTNLFPYPSGGASTVGD